MCHDDRRPPRRSAARSSTAVRIVDAAPGKVSTAPVRAVMTPDQRAVLTRRCAGMTVTQIAAERAKSYRSVHAILMRIRNRSRLGHLTLSDATGVLCYSLGFSRGQRAAITPGAALSPEDV